MASSAMVWRSALIDNLLLEYDLLRFAMSHLSVATPQITQLEEEVHSQGNYFINPYDRLISSTTKFI